MEFPTIDKFAKDVAEKVLDEFIYEGKTIREWVELLAKQQPCEDAISREAVLEIINFEDNWLFDAKSHNTDTQTAFSTIKLKISDLPSVQPQPKIGTWIADVDRWGDIITTVNGYRCSECNAFNTDRDNYCPNCGAKMTELESS